MKNLGFRFYFYVFCALLNLNSAIYSALHEQAFWFVMNAGFFIYLFFAAKAELDNRNNNSDNDQ